MPSAFGPHRFDTTHRAVVVGAHHGTAAPPDVVLVDAPPDPGDGDVADIVDRTVRSTGRPVVVRTTIPHVLAAALAAGAAGGFDDSGAADEGYLSVAAAGGGTVLLTLPERAARLDDCLAEVRSAAARARRAGLDAEHVALGVPSRIAARPAAAECRAYVEAITGEGIAAMTSVCDPGSDAGGAEAIALQTALTVAGVRVFVTDDVRRSRRVSTVVSELLTARAAGEVAP